MQKLVVPAILAAVVLVAGIFVYLPVDKASTVHTTIQQSMNKPIVVTMPVGNATVGGFGNDLPVTNNATNSFAGTASILAFFEEGEGDDEGCTVAADANENGAIASGEVVASVGSAGGGVKQATGTFAAATTDAIIVASNYTQQAGSIDTSSSYCIFTIYIDQSGA